MNFKYRARAVDGEMVEGYVDADDQKTALDTLRGRGMIVINLNAQGSTQTKTPASQKKSSSSGGS